MATPEATCLFCRIVRGELPNEKVAETDDLYAFRDINPQAPYHILVVPKRHIPTVNDLPEADADLVGRMILLARDFAEDQDFAAEGYRLVLNTNRAAGQSVFHIHLHLLGGRHLSWPPG